MNFEDGKSEISRALRGNLKTPLRDEVAAWEDIKAIIASAARSAFPPFDDLVYSLGLIYAYQTGMLPGYTNSDNETLFERFADTIVKRVAPMATRNKLRTAIRKMDARHNPRFKADLDRIAAARNVLSVHQQPRPLGGVQEIRKSPPRFQAPQ